MPFPCPPLLGTSKSSLAGFGGDPRVGSFEGGELSVPLSVSRGPCLPGLPASVSTFGALTSVFGAPERCRKHGLGSPFAPEFAPPEIQGPWLCFLQASVSLSLQTGLRGPPIILSAGPGESRVRPGPGRVPGSSQVWGATSGRGAGFWGALLRLGSRARVAATPLHHQGVSLHRPAGAGPVGPAPHHKWDPALARGPAAVAECPGRGARTRHVERRAAAEAEAVADADGRAAGPGEHLGKDGGHMGTPEHQGRARPGVHTLHPAPEAALCWRRVPGTSRGGVFLENPD